MVAAVKYCLSAKTFFTRQTSHFQVYNLVCGVIDLLKNIKLERNYKLWRGEVRGRRPVLAGENDLHGTRDIPNLAHLYMGGRSAVDGRR